MVVGVRYHRRSATSLVHGLQSLSRLLRYCIWVKCLARSLGANPQCEEIFGLVGSPNGMLHAWVVGGFMEMTSSDFDGLRAVCEIKSIHQWRHVLTFW